MMVKTYKELKTAGVEKTPALIVEEKQEDKQPEIIDRNVYVLQHPEFEVHSPKTFEYKVKEKYYSVVKGIVKVYNEIEKRELEEHGFYYITKFKAV